MVVVIASCANVDDYDVVHLAIPMTPRRVRELLNLMDTIQALKATNSAVWRLSAWDDSIKGYGFLDGVMEDDLQELPDDALDTEEPIAIACGCVHVTDEGMTWEAKERTTLIASETVKTVTRALLERWAGPADQKSDISIDRTAPTPFQKQAHAVREFFNEFRDALEKDEPIRGCDVVDALRAFYDDYKAVS